MVILEMLWLTRHNQEINWKKGKVKMTRCLEECGKQWRLEQGKSGWQKQKEEEAKEEAERKWEEWEMRRRKGRKIAEVKKVAEKWEIWDEEEKAARSEVEARKLVLEKFHQWIKVFGKKQSERMPMKVWDHTIEVKERFVLRKGKVYLLSREKREKRVYKGTAEKGIHLTIKITTDSTSILCGKEGWKEENGPGL